MGMKNMTDDTENGKARGRVRRNVCWEMENEQLFFLSPLEEC